MNPFESWSNKLNIPKRQSGVKKKMTMMYKMGNPVQIRVHFPRALAALRGMFLRNGTGYQIRIPKILKNKWQRATCNELTPLATKDARRPVNVVPIFAPSVKGNICSSWRAPIPTNGVRTDVVIEELCTRMVRPHPIRIAKYPFMLVAL